jgi:hypothetical protein
MAWSRAARNLYIRPQFIRRSRGRSSCFRWPRREPLRSITLSVPTRSGMCLNAYVRDRWRYPEGVSGNRAKPLGGLGFSTSPDAAEPRRRPQPPNSPSLPQKARPCPYPIERQQRPLLSSSPRRGQVPCYSICQRRDLQAMRAWYLVAEPMTPVRASRRPQQTFLPESLAAKRPSSVEVEEAQRERSDRPYRSFQPKRMKLITTQALSTEPATRP